MMKNKTTDYILGMITGIAIMVAVYSCSTNLYAAGGYTSRGDSKWNPLYVKVVK